MVNVDGLPEQVRREDEEEDESHRQDVVRVLEQELDEAVVALLQVGGVAFALDPLVDDVAAAAVVVVGSVDITEDMAVVLSHLGRRLKAEDGLFHFLVVAGTSSDLGKKIAAGKRCQPEIENREKTLPR